LPATGGGVTDELEVEEEEEEEDEAVPAAPLAAVREDVKSRAPREDSLAGSGARITPIWFPIVLS
jgi:hypothetical protein